MNIEIFDVELGQCAMIHCPNGQKIMIDAGHNASRHWHPSSHFYGQSIERLVISNYDEDHVSDIVDLQKHCNVRTIYRNTSISSSHLVSMKSLLGMGAGIRHIYDWLKSIESPNGGTWLNPVDMAGVNITHYQNPYGTFTDTNNLSLTSDDGREVSSSEEFETFAQAKSFVENYVRMRNSSAAKIAA